MWKYAVAALLAFVCARADASAITVYSDVGRLAASAFGCAAVLSSDSPQITTGGAVCTSYGQAYGGRVLDGAEHSVSALDPKFESPWGARGAITPQSNGFSLYLEAFTGPVAGIPFCGARPCRPTESNAQSSFDWHAVLGVSGGDVMLRVSDNTFVFDPWTLVIRDLTSDALLGDSRRALLLDGHRYAFDFSMTNLGSTCMRSCASGLLFTFDGAQIVPVPAPASWGMMLVGLASVAGLRRAQRTSSL